jgi:hypothetical protein
MFNTNTVREEKVEEQKKAEVNKICKLVALDRLLKALYAGGK